jgi:hypothetical protein
VRGGIGALVVSASAILVGLYVLTAVQRMRYPFELEWMEGGSLEHVKRVLDGKPIYAAPSLEFSAFLYCPLYYYVSAPLCAVMGLGLFPLRLVSFLASLGTLALVFSIVRRHTNSLVPAALGAGLYASMFPTSGGWYDLARVDSLALFLLLVATRLVMAAPTRRHLALAGAALALSVLTKQSMLLVAPVLALRALHAGRLRGAALFATCFVGVAGVAMAALEVQSHGWFWYYAFEIPRSHTMQQREYLITGYWTEEVLRATPIASTLAAIGAVQLGFRAPRDNWFLPAFGSSLVLLSYVTRLHMGSYANDLMPGLASLAILASVGLYELQSNANWEKWGVTWFVGVVQLGTLAFSPAGFMPAKGSVAMGEKLVEWLRTTPGEVLVVQHPYLNTLAGKPSQCHFMASVDIELSTRDERGGRARLRRQFEQALAQRRFAQIVVDHDWFLYDDALKANYVLTRSVPIPAPDALWPVTGTRWRPSMIWVPRPR